MMSHTTVPTRFFNEVALHLTSCLFGDAFGASQIMLIVGPPGSGKTFNIERSMSALSVTSEVFSADHVESFQANHPIESLDARLSSVRRSIASGELSALIMDDADLLLGRYPGVQYTHNLQHLNQKLMEVATGYRQHGACPVYLCANDPSVLHSPLVRLGRARVFEWRPNRDEVIMVVQNLFPYLHWEDAAGLESAFPSESPAFFGRLRQQVMDAYLSVRLHRDVRSLLGEALAVSNGVSKPPTIRPSLSQLIELGNGIQAERALINDEVHHARADT